MIGDTIGSTQASLQASAGELAAFEAFAFTRFVRFAVVSFILFNWSLSKIVAPQLFSCSLKIGNASSI
jgi:hypothetical protein